MKHSTTMRALVETALSGRAHASGETVQLGWFVFRIKAAGKPPLLESLDFRQMASFTEDFGEAERICAMQLRALADAGVSECPCTLQQFALVSNSYSPKRADVFIERQQEAEGNDSGWYVGVVHESLDVDDSSSLTRRSLYEITIYDKRLAPYWLLPPGTLVSIAHSATLPA